MSGNELSHVSALLAELDRQRALGVDPSASTVFVKAPANMQRDLADGRICDEDFWDRLKRWLEGVA